mmetsp:Transcript_12298/g.32408  ORF Transcript_12298/g.32408 Transcript_12298/m.32408 type:complete len:226 (-) Transcript_12298:1073-1750(-)
MASKSSPSQASSSAAAARSRAAFSFSISAFKLRVTALIHSSMSISPLLSASTSSRFASIFSGSSKSLSTASLHSRMKPITRLSSFKAVKISSRDKVPESSASMIMKHVRARLRTFIRFSNAGSPLPFILLLTAFSPNTNLRSRFLTFSRNVSAFFSSTFTEFFHLSLKANCASRFFCLSRIIFLSIHLIDRNCNSYASRPYKSLPSACNRFCFNSSDSMPSGFGI